MGLVQYEFIKELLHTRPNALQNRWEIFAFFLNELHWFCLLVLPGPSLCHAGS